MENEVQISMPKIGDKAPEFKASTTQGRINFPADYNGKWIILFSHPSDFTPVCTSEFMTFASMNEEFTKLNCQLIGLSVDGLHSHIAWLRTITEKIEYRGIKNIPIEFPLIDDVGMHIARQYGMLQPSESTTAAVRAVFFIDPNGTIRAMIYYPLVLGRNFDEIKRVLIALQTSDAFHIALPADWRMGDDILMPTPNTSDAAQQRVEDDSSQIKCYDWFFCTKPLNKHTIEEKLYQQ
ncbi:MAG: peroxiredoxin [Rikenellaceae bacterium]